MGDTKVVSLKGGPIYAGEADPRVVAYLEALLEQARSGEIVAVTLGKIFRDGSSSQGSCGTLDTTVMIGCLAKIQHDLMQDN